MSLTYGEMFAGADGAGMGLTRAGLTKIWHCEIDPSCQSILRRDHPDIPLIGDVNDLEAMSDRGELLAPDVIWMSPPCQDLSVAGKRGGLDGNRSGLFRVAIEAAESFRGRGTRWILMEQVPGLLSSNEGRDFREVVSSFLRIGAVDVGWRVLDSQFFGVLQRRRRVFFAVDFRGRSAGEILSLAQGLRGDTPPSRKAREEAAACLTSGSHGSGSNAAGRRREDDENLVAAWDELQITSKANRSRVEPGPSPTLNSGGGMSIISKCVPTRGDRFDAETETLVPETVVPELSGTLSASGAGTSRPGGQGSELDFCVPESGPRWRVRRLMPIETERLQGYPDNHTLTGHDGKQMADSVRYRMCGNGVTSTVSEWIGRNLLNAVKHETE